jgi:glycosidase
MLVTRRILEISIPHASSTGTFCDAMHLPEQLARDGFNTVYMLPWMKVNRTLSHSPYAVVNHLEVNEMLGTLSDVEAWIACCHSSGLQVILDVPLNHTSPEHSWTANSDWYSRTEEGAMRPPQGSGWNDVVQLNHSCEEVKTACIEVMSFWLNLGIDGFRLDAASFMPFGFVESIISNVRQVHSHVLFWGDGVSNAGTKSCFDAWFHHEAFYLAKQDMKAWKNLVESHQGNGIFYLTNHDTLCNGTSPELEWQGAYNEMKEILMAANKHVLQSWPEWRDPLSSYSFLLK